MPLSMMEGNIVTAYYLGAAIPLTIIPWYNSKTYGSLHLVINAGGAVVFTVIIRKTISCLNWILEKLKHSRNLGDSITPWKTAGNKDLQWNGISSVGGFYEGNSSGGI